MKFTTGTGMEIEWTPDAGLSGHHGLIDQVERVIVDGRSCGCNYWTAIEPSLDSEWDAYLTICGALAIITGEEPKVDQVPDNPAGYQPEGVVESTTVTTTVTAGGFSIQETATD